MSIREKLEYFQNKINSITFYTKKYFSNKGEDGGRRDAAHLLGSRGSSQTKLVCVGHCVTLGEPSGAKSHHSPDGRQPWFVPAPATTEQQEPSLGPDWGLVLESVRLLKIPMNQKHKHHQKKKKQRKNKRL